MTRTGEDHVPKRRHDRDPDPAEYERILLQQQQDGEPSKPLSKSQMKKLRRREEWEAGRDNRKAKRKQKTQEKKARKREAREEEQEAQRVQRQLPKSSLEGEQDENGESVEESVRPQTQQIKPSRPKHRRPIQLPITIIIDCGFDSLMMEKERISLGSQITRAYSDNYRALYQAHLVITSWGGLLKERFDTVLHRHYLNWKGVRIEKGDFVEAAEKMNTIMRDEKKGGKLVGCFQRHADDVADKAASLQDQDRLRNEREATEESSSILKEHQSSMTNGHAPAHDTSHSLDPESAQKQPHQSEPSSDTNPNTSDPQAPRPKGETIYLTSDSPDTLTTLFPYSTYIIGGLVDKNRHKGICYKTARDRGVKTAKLPIGEYLEMSSRKVLATNHVVEILIRWMEEVAKSGEEGAWGRAFLRVIPKRKGGKLIGVGQEEEVEDEWDGFGEAEADKVDENGADEMQQDD